MAFKDKECRVRGRKVDHLRLKDEGSYFCKDYQVTPSGGSLGVG